MKFVVLGGITKGKNLRSKFNNIFMRFIVSECFILKWFLQQEMKFKEFFHEPEAPQ